MDGESFGAGEAELLEEVDSWGGCSVGVAVDRRRISDGWVWRKTTMSLQEEECHAERSSGAGEIRGTFLRRGVCW